MSSWTGKAVASFLVARKGLEGGCSEHRDTRVFSKPGLWGHGIPAFFLNEDSYQLILVVSQLGGAGGYPTLLSPSVLRLLLVPGQPLPDIPLGQICHVRVLQDRPGLQFPLEVQVERPQVQGRSCRWFLFVHSVLPLSGQIDRHGILEGGRTVLVTEGGGLETL